MEILKVPQGEFRLERYPHQKNDRLRAWDAADEYLLNHISKEVNLEKKLKILIINDSFGALASALSKHSLAVWTDSWLAHEGIYQNFSINKISPDNLKIFDSIETPEDSYDLVLIKITKGLALLEDQLARIKPFISNTTKIIAAGMVKSIHTSTLKLFEKYIGSTKTSLAKKKARLIFCSIDENIKVVKSPYPKSYVLEETSYVIFNQANVFSRESLDVGTRFFLTHIPHSEKYKNIIDLACGNGVVGLIAADKNPDAVIHFLDESYMAIESAKETFKAAFKEQHKATFQVNDCLTGWKENSADLILNNPPFHQDNAIGDKVAWQMFKQSKGILKKGGELWVIGNRHLGYHIKLKKIFSNCDIVATNKKFVILRTIKQ